MTKNNTVGDYIREQRMKKHWTQVDLSEKTGIPQQSLSMYESGKRKPGLQAVKKLAETLEIPEDELLKHASNTRENRYNKVPLSENENFLLCLFRQMNEDNRKVLLKKALDLT